jgi:DNA-binding transcriptional LysR family regulator
MMHSWDEIRTAFHVARLGTVSGAADALGVHHATVIRHIDALEGTLGVKLFQRHARGYTATESGLDLLQVAKATDDQFAQLAGRIKGRGEDVSGDLVVTSVPTISEQLSPILASFALEHPGLRMRYVTGSQIMRLEYGEAHVAIRAGNAPKDPDNVVQPFGRLELGLYMSKSYIERMGRPASLDDLDGHRFICLSGTGSRAPFVRWLSERVAPEQIVFSASEMSALNVALKTGVGIGFATVREAALMPELESVAPPLPEWEVPLWLVTHVDLHRSTKVQAFLRHLKEQANDW